MTIQLRLKESNPASEWSSVGAQLLKDGDPIQVIP